MDQWQFYPTPKSLAERLYSKLTKPITRMLEPHGGNGDLADMAPDRTSHHGRVERYPIDVVEINLSRHETLRGKGYTVVGIDFLAFQNAAQYSTIVGNPPFALGCTHLLHAWDIAWNAEFSWLLNAETIRNPYTAERRRLCDLIERYGSVEFVQDAFLTEDTERKTPVEVAIVYLNKEVDLGANLFGNLLSELRADKETGAGLAGDFREQNALALPASTIDNMVLAFEASVRSMRDAVHADFRARYYARLLGETLAVHRSPELAVRDTLSASDIQAELNSRYLELKDRAWTGLLSSTNVSSRLTSKARRRLENEFSVIQKLEFSKANIYAFIMGLINKQGDMQQDILCDLFDSIVQHHENSTFYYARWKSNGRHYVGMKIRHTRFILDGFHGESYSRGLTYSQESRLQDIDRAMAILDGRLEPEFSLVDAFNTRFDDLSCHQRVSTSYFDIRWYPARGSLHFFPRNLKLIERLNLAVGRARRWLPSETEKAGPGFWKQYENSARLDNEIRSAAPEMDGYGVWRSPLWRMAHGSAESREEAAEALGKAVFGVLMKHGIDPTLCLENQANDEQGQLQLLELAA